MTGADETFQQILETLTAAFDAGRDDAAGDEGGLEQAEVIAGEVKNLAHRAEVGRTAEVDGGDTDQGFIDDAEEGVGRRGGSGVATVHAEVDGDVEDLGALRVVHAEEEDVAPSAVGEVHAQRGALAEDGEETRGGTGAEFGSYAERVIGGVADAKHPLVTAHGADAAADLVGERLEGEAVVGGGEGGGEAVAGSLLALGGEERIDGFLETTGEQLFVAAEGNETWGSGLDWAVSSEFGGEMEAVDGIEEEKGADAVVEVGGLTAEVVEDLAGGEQMGGVEGGTEEVEGLIADAWIIGGDDRQEGVIHGGRAGVEGWGGGTGWLAWPAEFAAGEEVDEQAEDLVAMAAVEAEGELGVEQAVADTDIVASAFGFEGEVAFAFGELIEGGGELERGGLGGGGFEQFHDARGEHVHAEETEVMTGTEAGDEQALFGFGGGGFFDDLGDFVEAVLTGEAAGTDGAVEGEAAFVGGLNGGDGATVVGGDFDQLGGAATRFVGGVQMIADEEEKGGVTDERSAAEDGIAEAARLGLFEELEAARVGTGGGAECLLIAGGGDDADFLDAGGEGFLDDDAESGFGFSVAIDEGLEGESPLAAAGGGDECLFDLHGRALTSPVDARGSIPGRSEQLGDSSGTTRSAPGRHGSRHTPSMATANRRSRPQRTTTAPP